MALATAREPAMHARHGGRGGRPCAGLQGHRGAPAVPPPPAAAAERCCRLPPDDRSARKTSAGKRGFAAPPAGMRGSPGLLAASPALPGPPRPHYRPSAGSRATHH